MRGPQRASGIPSIGEAPLLQPRLVKVEHIRDKAHGLEHLSDARAELLVVVVPGGVARLQLRHHRGVLAQNLCLDQRPGSAALLDAVLDGVLLIRGHGRDGALALRAEPG